MRSYGWPGNVRELQNICERASVLTRGSTIHQDILAPWLAVSGPRAVSVSMANAHAAPITPQVCVKTLDELEREQILHTLGVNNGNRLRTAQSLGIGVRTLGLKLKKWKELNLVAQTV
jgi:DNA-binding NtrC family response regulator